MEYDYILLMDQLIPNSVLHLRLYCLHNSEDLKYIKIVNSIASPKKRMGEVHKICELFGPMPRQEYDNEDDDLQLISNTFNLTILKSLKGLVNDVESTDKVFKTPTKA